jgi:RNA polymerase sigma-70 factor (ECF subfamily)
VALTDVDRSLLTRCLTQKPRAWEDFVDRFIGLVVHVVNHSAQARSIRLTPQDREDLVADVFLEIVKEDYAILRHFRGESSLSTYLTVVSRRVVTQQLLKRKPAARLGDDQSDRNGHEPAQDLERVQDRDEVERLLGELEGAEAQVVRLFHLEGKSYQEISSAVGMPENSIGPTLYRAREKMRRAAANHATS